MFKFMQGRLSSLMPRLFVFTKFVIIITTVLVDSIIIITIISQLLLFIVTLYKLQYMTYGTVGECLSFRRGSTCCEK